MPKRVTPAWSKRDTQAVRTLIRKYGREEVIKTARSIVLIEDLDDVLLPALADMEKIWEHQRKGRLKAPSGRQLITREEIIRAEIGARFPNLTNVDKQAIIRRWVRKLRDGVYKTRD